jgi:transposase
LARYDVPDEAWALISTLLPPERNRVSGGRPYLEHRPVMNGIFWVLCSGAPWRDLPERYGNWKTIYNRFNRWSKSGVINSIFNKLLQILDENELIDWDAIALDGSNIRALKAAAGAKKNTLMNSRIMGLVALEVVLAPKSIWRQTARGCR